MTEIPRGTAQISAQMLQMYNVIHTWQKYRQIMNITPQRQSVIALNECAQRKKELSVVLLKRNQWILLKQIS